MTLLHPKAQLLWLQSLHFIVTRKCGPLRLSLTLIDFFQRTAKDAIHSPSFLFQLDQETVLVGRFVESCFFVITTSSFVSWGINHIFNFNHSVLSSIIVRSFLSFVFVARLFVVSSTLIRFSVGTGKQTSTSEAAHKKSVCSLVRSFVRARVYSFFFLLLLFFCARLFVPVFIRASVLAKRSYIFLVLFEHRRFIVRAPSFPCPYDLSFIVVVVVFGSVICAFNLLMSDNPFLLWSWGPELTIQNNLFLIAFSNCSVLCDWVSFYIL